MIDRLRRLLRTPFAVPPGGGGRLKDMPFFCAVLIYLVWFLLGGCPIQPQALFHIMLMVVVPLTAVLSVQRERDLGTLTGLVLTPVDRGLIVRGRCLWNVKIWSGAIVALLPMYFVLARRGVVSMRDILPAYSEPLRWLIFFSPRPIWMSAAADFLAWACQLFPSAQAAVPSDTIIRLGDSACNVIGSPVFFGAVIAVAFPLVAFSDLLMIFYLSATSLYAAIRCRTLAGSLAMAYFLGPGLYVTVLSMDVWFALLCSSRRLNSMPAVLLFSLVVVFPVGCLLATIKLPFMLMRRSAGMFDAWAAD